MSSKILIRLGVLEDAPTVFFQEPVAAGPCETLWGQTVATHVKLPGDDYNFSRTSRLSLRFSQIS